MINRHLLRIKVLQITYAYFTKENNIDLALKELDKSIKQTKELYVKLLLLPIELRDIAEQKLENKQHTHTNREDDTSIEKFVNNSFLKFLQDSKSLHTYCKNEKITWAGQEDILINLYNQLLKMPFFQDYLNASEQSEAKDQRLIFTMFSKFFAKKVNLEDIIEEQNLYWNDDLWVVLPLLEQAIKKADITKNEFFIPDLYKNADDEAFAKNLFLKTVRLQDEAKILIEKIASNWEYERIALIDKILLSMGMTELLHFETIPVKVTLNEYVEISKYYSTENSSIFINGILDKIAKEKDAASLKKGAGLIGNN
ncbi:NusB antitermination factor [Balneicella halophila]|uniref:NusB antitermination factor n=1 Tax=Balneicella halophila TaxID=1537566 RepID=A0A7L4UQ99_BALHA|nr:transcription antitermination factor NusB [Balneicella halophila]PVX50772.1 NusB antitermination factor [Balneicella halophila]